MTTSDTVSVRFSPGQSRLRLRELTGRDERAVAGTSTSDALALLDALIIEDPAALASPPRADDLVASDRDRLLVAIYRRAFGERIENTVTCEKCENRFDIDFSLDGLIDSLESNRAHPAVQSIAQNTFQTEQGLRFRLPTGREELQLSGLSASDAEQALLRCCIAESDTAQIEADALQQLLSEVAPLVDLELEARCPECQRTHALQFDIQSYLLNALLGERRRLTLEIHRLAVSYGWGLNDILSLHRSERRHFVELIDTESAHHRRGPL